jgi:hypothetical protein
MRIGATAGLIFTLSILAPVSRAQSPPAEPETHIETTQDLLARLTPEQKQRYDQAGKAFNTQLFSEALDAYKLLLKELPGDPVLSKFLAEAALNKGETALALNTLRPIAAATPDDWQAAVLLTRACAESGDNTCRDASMAHLLDLHKRGLTPPHMQQYIVERIFFSSGKSVTIYTSLEPWGHYHVYNYAQIFDNTGHMELRVTVESDDTDQAFFAKEHPKEAAAGLRSFSLDGYKDSGMNDKNQRIETHFTFKFFVGQPSYDTVREAILNIASGKTSPSSSRTNVLGQ